MKSYSWIVVAVLIILFSIGQTSAGTPNYINGTTYDTTWDERRIPSSQVVYGSNDDTILVQELIPATAFTIGNDTIYINNNFTFFKRDKFKISPIMTFPKILLASKMIDYNTTVAYLVFPYSLSRVKDYISENELRMGNWTFRAGNEHIDIYDDNKTQNILPKSAYTFMIVNDEIRLYFLKAEANKLLGNISFEMNSWTINGSTTPAWQNTSMDNVTMNGLDANNVVVGNGADWFDRADSLSLGASWKKVAGVDFTEIKNQTLLWNTLTTSYPPVYQNISLTESNYSVSFVYYNYNAAVANRINVCFNTQSYTDHKPSSCLELREDSASVFAYYNQTTAYIGAAAMGISLTNNTQLTFITSVNSTNLTIKVYQNKTYKGETSLWDARNSMGTVSIGTAISCSNCIAIDNFRVFKSLSGNLTAWHDSGTGIEVYQIDVNATGNYTISYGDNSTRIVSESQAYYTTNASTWNNNSYTVTGTKYQDAFTNITLLGDTTTTPELVEVVLWSQAAGEPPIAAIREEQVEFIFI